MSEPYQPSGSPGSPANTAVPGAVGTPPSSAAVMKFKSCRWRRPPEDGPECCGHRDVLPLAGTSFNPEAWCPECTLFKLRRTPKKRSPDDYRY
jgi:hypothetical protein